MAYLRVNDNISLHVGSVGENNTVFCELPYFSPGLDRNQPAGDVFGDTSIDPCRNLTVKAVVHN